MFSIGVANPESRTKGTMEANTPRNACCCVLQSEEMKSPTPVQARMKSRKLRVSSPRLPRQGTPKTVRARMWMAIPIPKAITAAGRALPITISRGESGETSSCSNVPSSRSRATLMPETTRASIWVSTTSSTGRVNHR